jgi:hypothetical protein
MLPEVAPIVAECLLQTILTGQTVPHNTLIESYVDLTPYSITQVRQYQLGAGPAEETSHRIIIERHTDDEPSVFELCIGNSNPRSVDFKVAYSWMDHTERWDNVNAWGALIGIDSISSLLAKAPSELHELDEQGRCTSRIAGDLSILTEPVVDVKTLHETPVTQPTPSAHWIPKAIQLSAPLYGEQARLMEQLSSEVWSAVVESGLLRTIDAFTGEHADLQKRLLDRASTRFPTEFMVEFLRLVQLGPSDSGHIDDYVNSLEDLPAAEISEALTIEQGAEATRLSSSDEPLFSEDPIVCQVSSSAKIHLFSDELGPVHLEYASTGQSHGGVLIRDANPFNFAAPTVGITFLDGSPSLREIAGRWQIMRSIASVGEKTLNRKSLEVNLVELAKNPAGQLVSADIGNNRVLMSFNPPKKIEALRDAVGGE